MGTGITAINEKVEKESVFVSRMNKRGAKDANNNYPTN